MEDAHSGELVVIARAVKPRGLKGEIVAELLTDFPERFEEVEELVLVTPGGERKTGHLENHWFQNDRVILKLAGYNDVETAKELVGFEFAVPEQDRVPLPRITTTTGNWKVVPSEPAIQTSAKFGQ